MKIAINTKHGGFGLSPKALTAYLKVKGKPCFFFEGELIDSKYVYTPIDIEHDDEVPYFYTPFTVPNPNDYIKTENSSDIYIDEWEIPRNDPDLISIIEQMGSNANGRCAALKIVEIPDDVDWVVQEYDGLEWVAEKHRTWQ